MRRLALITTAITAFVTSSLFAGPPDVKQVAPAPPPCQFGTGWYFALDGGANVYQMFDDSFSREFPNLGAKVDLHIDHNVGGYGGIKLGYVFGTGSIRWAIEEDMFYNGVSTSSHVNVRAEEESQQVLHSDNMLNSGAFMTNFILRFASWGQFQPYAGAGVGAYWAETGGGDITSDIGRGRTFSTGGGNSSGSFAWDVVAGADYFWNCKMSTFIEYHYLDYVALDVGDGNHQFGQHLVGAGFKFHF